MRDGFLIYSSETLHYAELKVHGVLYKQGETRTIFNISKFNRRTFTISLAHKALYM